jgi:hypothetical protein
MNKNAFFERFREVQKMHILNCSVRLFSAAHCKLIYVLHKNALFHWATTVVIIDDCIPSIVLER